MVMSIQELFDRLKGLDGRLAEDEVYKIVWEETQSGNFDPAAQARAAVEVGTDKEALRAAYIKHRVRRIYDELEAEKNRFQVKELESERSNKENERKRRKEEELAKEQKRKEEMLAKERKRKQAVLARFGLRNEGESQQKRKNGLPWGAIIFWIFCSYIVFVTFEFLRT